MPAKIASTESPLKARLPGLDGLRAIAVLLVLGFHFLPQIFPGGFIGVDVFFVISGFLITTLLLREHTANGRISLAGFWARRARRLLPALFLVLFACAALALLFSPDSRVKLGEQLLGGVLFVSNWVLIAAGTDYFTQETPELFRNMWSLAIEEQFYLVMPLLILLLLKLRSWRKRLLIIIFGAAVSLGLLTLYAALGFPATRIYFGTDSHVFGLLGGVALAIYWHQRVTMRPRPPVPPEPTLFRKITWIIFQIIWVIGTSIGIAYLILLALFAPAHAETNPLIFLSATVLTLIMINCIARTGSIPGIAIDNPLFRWIGERSYGIYLWHWPLLVLAGHLPGGLPDWLTHGIAFVLTFIIAHLSYTFLETPIREAGFAGAIANLFRKSTAALPRFGLVASLVGILAALPFATLAALTAPQMSSAQAAIEESTKLVAELQAQQAQQAQQQATQAQAQQNTPGAQNTPAQPVEEALNDWGWPAVPGTKITAVGDSVMLASAAALTKKFPGIVIDAAVSRSLGAGLNIVLSGKIEVREYLVLGLGTNGPINPQEIDAVRRAFPNTKIVVVNAYGERSWIPGVNQALQGYADSNRGVTLADWATVAGAHKDTLAGDGIHPSPQTGGALYADEVAKAVHILGTPSENPHKKPRNSPKPVP